VAAVAGSRLSHAVPGHGHLLMLATAGLIGVTAARMVRRPRAARRRAPGAAIGVVAGGLSGLLGIGGGVVLVPVFSGWLGLPIKTTVATSLVCVGLFAVPGTITHAALGGIDWSYAVPLTAGVVPGARLGSGLAVRATETGLRRTVAVALGIVALVYAAAELAAF
jgi:uncharacterized protein